MYFVLFEVTHVAVFIIFFFLCVGVSSFQSKMSALASSQVVWNTLRFTDSSKVTKNGEG